MGRIDCGLLPGCSPHKEQAFAYASHINRNDNRWIFRQSASLTSANHYLFARLTAPRKSPYSHRFPCQFGMRISAHLLAGAKGLHLDSSDRFDELASSHLPRLISTVRLFDRLTIAAMLRILMIARHSDDLDTTPHGPSSSWRAYQLTSTRRVQTVQTLKGKVLQIDGGRTLI